MKGKYGVFWGFERGVLGMLLAFMVIGCGDESDPTSPGGSTSSTKIGTPTNFRVQSKEGPLGSYGIFLKWKTRSLV